MVNRTTYTVDKHFSDILKYPLVYVDVCFAVLAPAFLQVLAEFHNKALQYINGKAQNAALSWSRAPGRSLHHVYEYPETWL